MIVQKTVAIFLMACIFNPMCCCFGNVFQADADVSEVHSCCENDAGNSADKGEKDCPHNTIEKYKGYSDSLARSTVNAAYAPFVYEIFHSEELQLLKEVKVLRVVADGGAIVPAFSLQQMNCTYLL